MTKLCLTIFALMIFTAGCQPDATTLPVETKMTSTSTVPVESVIPSPTPQEAATESAPQKIATVDVYRIWWSYDSKSLYFDTNGGDFFEYDVANKETKRLENEIDPQGKPQPELLQQLPDRAWNVSQSPSRTKALYVIPVGPTPTPPSDWGQNLEVPAELWFWQDGDSEFVGEIFDCIYDYRWSKNEEKVLIWSVREPGCDNAGATLVDLNELWITPLFPDSSWPALRCCEFSPDGKRLIYMADDEIHMLDAATLETMKIPAPPFGYITARWIDARRLLVFYPHILFEPLNLGIYDLETNSLEQLLSESDPLIEGRRPFKTSISPDGLWLAFATGETQYHLDSVWLMRIPDA